MTSVSWNASDFEILSLLPLLVCKLCVFSVWRRLLIPPPHTLFISNHNFTNYFNEQVKLKYEGVDTTGTTPDVLRGQHNRRYLCRHIIIGFSHFCSSKDSVRKNVL